MTATGLNRQWLGGMTVSVDGERVNLGDRFAYKGMLISSVPNLNVVTDYTNNSWTLKADLVRRYACRILRYLDAHGYVSATPLTPEEETPRLFLDLDSGYIRRGVNDMAKQGTNVPWRLTQNYLKDIRLLNHRKVDDGFLRFQRRYPLEFPRTSRRPGACRKQTTTSYHNSGYVMVRTSTWTSGPAGAACGLRTTSKFRALKRATDNAAKRSS